VGVPVEKEDRKESCQGNTALAQQQRKTM